MKDLSPRKEELEPIEIASIDEIRATQLERLKWSLNHAYNNVPMYKQRFDDAGVHPDDLQSLSDLAKFPFSYKNDLRDNYPFGMFAVPREQVARAGLVVARSIEFGKSYDITLRRWHETFNQKWEEITKLGFDERFRRMWNFYLTSCAATFDSGNCDVTQITVRRPA